MRRSPLLSRLVGQRAEAADLSPQELAIRRSAAEAELQEAERLYQKAALDAERGVSGAIHARSEAAGAVRLAEERLRDVMGAQVEADAQERDRQDRSNRDARAAQDRDGRTAMDRWAHSVADLEKAMAATVAAYEGMIAAKKVAHEALFRNPRVPNDKLIQMEVNVALEWLRLASNPADLTFPGTVGHGVQDPRELVPFSDQARAFQAQIGAALDKAAKRGRT